MTENEKMLASILLVRASGDWANRGCNDFDLARHIPNVEERRALVKAMHEDNMDPECFDPTNDYTIIPDFWLATFLASRVYPE